MSSNYHIIAPHKGNGKITLPPCYMSISVCKFSTETWLMFHSFESYYSTVLTRIASYHTIRANSLWYPISKLIKAAKSKKNNSSSIDAMKKSPNLNFRAEILLPAHSWKILLFFYQIETKYAHRKEMPRFKNKTFSLVVWRWNEYKNTTLYFAAFTYFKFFWPQKDFDRIMFLFSYLETERNANVTRLKCNSGLHC